MNFNYIICLAISSISISTVGHARNDAVRPGAAPVANYSGDVEPNHSETTFKVSESSAPVAKYTGEQFSKTLDVSQGGALDPARVGQAQSAADSAISQSEYIDQLYIKHQITKAEWRALKAGMTASMMAPINNLSPDSTLQKQTPSQPSRSVARGSTNNTPDSTPVAASPNSPSAPEEVSVSQYTRSETKRSLASVPETDPNEAGAGAQVLSLNSAGPLVVGTTLVPDKISEAQASETFKDNNNQKQLQMDENSKGQSANGQTVLLGASSGPGSDKGLDHDRAMLVAQKILQDHNAKAAKKTAKAATASGANESVGAPTASSIELAQAKAMASLQGLPKVKRVQGLDGKDGSPAKFSAEEVGAALALSKNRAPASVGDEVETGEEGLSNTSLFFIGLLGLFAGLATAYGLFMRPQKSFVQLMVPAAGEHFSIRPGSKAGEFILDIKDIRGKLIKTAGTLRPNSVTRASVLPPDLAARLGAKGNFERFELTLDGEFVATEKEEGYQVFPFDLSQSKKAS